MKAIFANKLKEIRKSKDLTQSELAEKIGVELRQIQRYEKDLIPPIEKVKKLSTTLDYDFFKIINTSQRDTNENKEDKKDAPANDQGDLYMKTIYNLSESVRTATEALRITAEALNKEADNKNRLITVIEQGKSVTASVEQDNLAMIHLALSRIPVVLAKIGAGKKWPTEESALAQITNELYSQKNVAGQKT